MKRRTSILPEREVICMFDDYATNEYVELQIAILIAYLKGGQ